MKALNPEDLRAFISSLFDPYGVQVFSSNQQIDTTNIPFYVVIQQISSAQQGSRVYQVDDVEYSKTTSNVLYSIHIIGKNAIMWANKLPALMRLTANVNKIKKLGVGILSTSASRDLSSAYDAGYEERAQLDLLLSQDVVVKAEQYHVNSVELDVHFEK